MAPPLATDQASLAPLGGDQRRSWAPRCMIGLGLLLGLYAAAYCALRYQRRFVHYALEDYPCDEQGSVNGPRTVWHAVDDGGLFDDGSERTAQSALVQVFLPLCWLESRWWALRDDDLAGAWARLPLWDPDPAD